MKWRIIGWNPLKLLKGQNLSEKPLEEKSRSGVIEYSFSCEFPKDATITLKDLKLVILQNPWVITSTPPLVTSQSKEQNTDLLKISFLAISESKAKLVEEQIRHLIVQ